MSKKLVVPATVSKLVAMALAESAFFTGAGVESEMNGRNHFMSADARKFWLENHLATFARSLKRVSWTVARRRVIPRATDLGQFAAQFALADATATGPVEIRKTHVEQASEEVRKNKRCQPGKPGQGEFCDF